MFEKPKTLNELSEDELQNLVSYLAGDWAGSGPSPGYSWREFFSESELAELPEWFNGWLAAFELEDLVSLEGEGSRPITLSLLKDAQRNEAAIFISTPDEPAERVGDPSYTTASITPEMLLPIVKKFSE
jgi:hypothetical protein